jgi:hypothetical protein
MKDTLKISGEKKGDKVSKMKRFTGRSATRVNVEGFPAFICIKKFL